MALRQLAKPQWQSYFDRISAELGAKLVEIEVTGLGVEDDVDAEGAHHFVLLRDPLSLPAP